MLKSNLFKLNRNRRYNYTPRYYQGKEIENPYDFDSTFTKYRDTYNANDFGKKLDSGAHLSALRRTKIGNYCVSDAMSLSHFIRYINEL